MSEDLHFTRGVPAPESYPIEELGEAATAALANHGARLLAYGPAAGFAPLREWLAGWHGLEPERVLLGNGSLQLLDLLCFTILQPADVVFTEAPSYDRALTLLRRHGAHVVGIPLEADGPDLAVLEAELRRNRPRFFYLMPDFQNPSGVTCSADKRSRLVELAERDGFLLLEDGPYRPLRYFGREEPALFQLAPHVTIHLTSLSKLAGPGLRVGYMLGDPGLLSRVARAAEDTYISPGLVAQGIAHEWCRRGRLPAQIARLRELYAPRLFACLAALDRHLPEAQATRPEGGFFLSVTLPRGIEASAVRLLAAKRGLQLADGQAFFPGPGGERFLRLPYCALSPDRIEEGVWRLASVVGELQADAGRATSGLLSAS